MAREGKSHATANGYRHGPGELQDGKHANDGEGQEHIFSVLWRIESEAWYAKLVVWQDQGIHPEVHGARPGQARSSTVSQARSSTVKHGQATTVKHGRSSKHCQARSSTVKHGSSTQCSGPAQETTSQQLIPQSRHRQVPPHALELPANIEVSVSEPHKSLSSSLSPAL